ncbi:NAD(P)-binding Rossmann-like domain protein [Leptospira inadai serovar Lyme str. 10]|uniref:NAD(P)-binding Rossmann-like domain protein n=2 Tax=Leptospira inadai serovar Lyme TaxID=293084 RepID=V6HAF0_9LEPT|nr:FAD-dependent oxidoreductase [Leptospira inadai]EQA35338.1 NAD(P)-binding Rossmann-like domain protein [Leptospira inadai serovar Lyme str. 10]PNV74162.1 NAD/FAD-binding protein [Leptospira inadai serovar Lyme]
MKIAIIGSGIAGLSACWYLGKEHEVTLIERHALVGMDAHGTDLDWNGKSIRIDVPFRAFKKNYYPCLLDLFKEADIAVRPVDYSFSLNYGDGTTYFGFSTFALGGNFFPIPYIACFSNSNSRKIFSDAMRFYEESENQLETLNEEQLTISDFLRKFRYSREFEDQYLIPMFSTINTCTSESAKNYPAEAVIRYHSKGLKFLRFLTAEKGTRDITNRLASRASKILLNSEPKQIVLNGNKVRLLFDNHEEYFDRVVIAAPANRAVSMLPDEHSREKELLSSFKYESSEVVTHSDPKFMPKQKKHWAPMCFALSKDGSRATATILLNKVLPEMGGTPVFQTWNPLIEPQPDSILSRSKFERPVIDLASKEMIRELKELQEMPGRKVWLCGSYARYGIPLLEAGVSTALDVKNWVESSIIKA